MAHDQQCDDLATVVSELLAAFPNPILKPGQRLRKREAEILNGAILAAHVAIEKADKQ